MKISFITTFPSYYDSFLNSVLVQRSIRNRQLKIEVIDMKEFADGSFRHIDDSPYGGGVGMLLKCEPVTKAIRYVRTQDSHVIAMDPIGKTLNQKSLKKLSHMSHLVILCGHYEGFDARIYDEVDECISVGDYILSGGELPSMLLADGVIRLLEGTLKSQSTIEESFENARLEHPQYTKPYSFEGKKVPDVLLSGNHAKIEEWKIVQSIERTKQYRPDLIQKYPLTEKEKEILKKEGKEMKYEKSCGAVVVKNDENHKLKILLIRQIQGHWCFPKGHVEENETEHETAKREIFEETGIEIQFLSDFRVSTGYSPREGIQKEVVYFLAEKTGGSDSVQLEEVSEIAWVSLIEANSLITYDSDAKILHQAIHALEKIDPDGEKWNIHSNID